MDLEWGLSVCIFIRIPADSDVTGLRMTLGEPLDNTENHWTWLMTLVEFLWFSNDLTPKSLQMVTAAMKLKDACSLEEKL